MAIVFSIPDEPLTPTGDNLQTLINLARKKDSSCHLILQTVTVTHGHSPDSLVIFWIAIEGLCQRQFLRRHVSLSEEPTVQPLYMLEASLIPFDLAWK